MLRMLSSEKLSQLRDHIGLGAADVEVAQQRGALSISLGNGISDGLMLIPDGGAVLGRAMHCAHYATQMHPVPTGTLGDEWVARRVVDGAVEGKVGIDDGLQVRALRSDAALRDERWVDGTASLGCQASSQGIQSAPDFVHPANPIRVQMGDLNASAGRVFDEPVLFQKSQRRQDRRARHMKLFGDFLLGDAFPGRQ